MVACVWRGPAVDTPATEAFVGKKLLRIHREVLPRDCWGRKLRGIILTCGIASNVKNSAVAVALGRLGGLEGGRVQAEELTIYGVDTDVWIWDQIKQ